jgi:dihydroorotate dehydrogenase electron transfer subunit
VDDIEGTIIANQRLVSDYFLLRVGLSKAMEKPEPGQFVMVKVPDTEIFLRRPFSIYGHDEETLTIMYRAIGKGTKRLSEAEKGHGTLVLGPLGRGFRIERRNAYVLVAGGIGVAGVRLLAGRLGKKASLFYGCSHREEVALIKDTTDTETHVSTLDGSYGFRGNVVQALGRYLESEKREDLEVFACGPEGMLKSLQVLLGPGKIPCQALVEERMACGMGLCFGCVKKTVDEKEPYKRVCREGPVFDLWEICL